MTIAAFLASECQKYTRPANNDKGDDSKWLRSNRVCRWLARRRHGWSNCDDRGSPAAESVLDEITVTAQKREQSIQDVGISITAFSGEQLQELGIVNSVDIAAMTPGVYISGNNGGQKTLFTIRGVTQNDFNDHTEAPVAVYVDDGYVAFGQGQIFGVFDLDRVEVLKGPQGTLFGRNATGGLVHYISKRPTRELETYTDLTYGSYHQIRVESALSGPLNDAISARVAMIYSKHDPFIKNDYPNRAVTLDGNPISPDHAGTGDEDTLGVGGNCSLV